MRLTHLFVLSLCITLAFAQQRSGFNSVIAALREFQNTDGGFFLAKGLESSLEATHYSLFLSSLFGMRDRIDSSAAAKFVESLKSSDGGYSNSPGQVSSLSAVKHALSAHGYLGSEIDKTAVTNYVRTHLDSETKLFFDKVGDRPSVQATATAFQIFNILGASQRDFVLKAATSVAAYLQDHVQNNAFVLPDEHADEVTANYYGILTGSLVGFKFSEPEQWAAWFTKRQTKAGGVISDSKDVNSVTLEATCNAVSAVYFLSKASGSNVKTAIDLKSLAQYLRGIPHDLKSASLAHTAVSRTTLFPELFQKSISYEVLNGNIEGDAIVLGTQIKPVVSVKSFYGLPHAGLNIEAVLTHKSIGEKKIPLRWNQEAQHYVADEFFDTTDKLGALKVVYNVRVNLVGEAVEFQLTDNKNIGYTMKVTPTATLGGKEVGPNSMVSAGTEFSFAVALNSGRAKITQGDFDLVFSVTDGSEVVLYSETKDCRGNTEAFNFAYSLQTINFPSGALIFRFQVKNADGVHTQQLLGYGIGARMVATHINYQSAQEYKIGDTVTVTMQPASLPDMSTVNLYNSKDANGKEVTTRTFYLDLYALDGEIATRTIKGVPSDKGGHLLYTFDIPISASFQSIGKHRFAFRYVPLRGNRDIHLGNYDSTSAELLDDTQPLTFNVKADLQVTDINNAPKDGNLFYGNDVSFTFKVVDAISGKNIMVDGTETGVSLNLRHIDGKGKSTVSSKVFATQTYDLKGAPAALSINWSVSPNAIKGPGVLDLSAEIAGGQEIPLVKASDKKPWKIDVTIGGTITATHKVETLSTPDGTHNIFLVTFELYCQGKKLSGANLRAVVTQIGGSSVNDFVIPVAREIGSDSYTVSWLAQDDAAPSGTYSLQIFREVDKAAEPLFTVSFDFTALHSNFLPFRTETFILGVLLVSLAVFSFKKYSIEYQPKK